MEVPKAAITTHVLDQTTGLPAADIHVKLEREGDEQHPLVAFTDKDGRIFNWCFIPYYQYGNDESEAKTLAHKEANEYILASLHTTQEWTLIYETKEYFESQGKVSVWSKISLNFETNERDPRLHWHMPLLLGPFGYTTYRGS